MCRPRRAYYKVDEIMGKGMNIGLQRYNISRRLKKMGYDTGTIEGILDHTDSTLEYYENLDNVMRAIESQGFIKEYEGVSADYWDEKTNVDKVEDCDERRTSEGDLCEDYLAAYHTIIDENDCDVVALEVGCPDQTAIHEACGCDDDAACYDEYIISSATEAPTPKKEKKPKPEIPKVKLGEYVEVSGRLLTSKQLEKLKRDGKLYVWRNNEEWLIEVSDIKINKED